MLTDMKQHYLTYIYEITIILFMKWATIYIVCLGILDGTCERIKEIYLPDMWHLYRSLFTKIIESLRLLPSKLFSPSWILLLSFQNPGYPASNHTVQLGCLTSISSPVCPEWNLSVQYFSLLLFLISMNSYGIGQGSVRRQNSNLNRKWLIQGIINYNGINYEEVNNSEGHGEDARKDGLTAVQAVLETVWHSFRQLAQLGPSIPLSKLKSLVRSLTLSSPFFPHPFLQIMNNWVVSSFELFRPVIMASIFFFFLTIYHVPGTVLSTL